MFGKGKNNKCRSSHHLQLHYVAKHLQSSTCFCLLRNPAFGYAFAKLHDRVIWTGQNRTSRLFRPHSSGSARLEPSGPAHCGRVRGGSWGSKNIDRQRSRALRILSETENWASCALSETSTLFILGCSRTGGGSKGSRPRWKFSVSQLQSPVPSLPGSDVSLLPAFPVSSLPDFHVSPLPGFPFCQLLGLHCSFSQLLKLYCSLSPRQRLNLSLHLSQHQSLNLWLYLHQCFCLKCLCRQYFSPCRLCPTPGPCPGFESICPL